MSKISRREFTKQTIKAGAGLAMSNLVSCNGKQTLMNDKIRVSIPKPIQIVIDDVGWWSGSDGHASQEPYRTGINRDHVPADYQAIVELGKKLGVRPQAATILCEWDRQNILKEVPTSTWMREKWDNSKWVGPWLDEAAEIINNNKDHYELTLHGVGHEYWADENATRAEWADKSGVMRPLDQVELHLDCFAKIMEQNQLGSFPASFVPTAFLHSFGISGDHNTSIASVVKKRGITYINTPFRSMFNAEAAQFDLLGIDDGVMTIDRGEDEINWNIIGGKPKSVITGVTCGLHWPNLLHEDPARNTEIVDGWVESLKPYNQKLESVLAPNSDLFQNQLVHHTCSKISIAGNSIELKFTDPNSVPSKFLHSSFMLKLETDSQLSIESDNIKLISSSFERVGDKYLYSLLLKRTSVQETAQIKISDVS